MKRKMVLAGLASLAAAAAVNAATISIDAQVDHVYTNAFVEVPLSEINTLPGAERWVHVNYYMSDGGFVSPQIGMANVAIDNNFVGGVGPIAGVDFTPNNPTVDTNGALPGGTAATWFAAGDSGANTHDLKNIVFTIASGITNPADPRAVLGQAAPQLLGDAYVSWNGTAPATLNVVITDWSINSGGVYSSVSTQGATGDSVPLGVPEPASLGLLALGGLLMARRRA